MSTLQVTTVTSPDANTPLILKTGNTSGGQIVMQAANNDVLFVGPLRFTANVTGDGSGFTLPSSNVANAAFGVANAAFGKANTALQNTSGTFAGDLAITGSTSIGSIYYKTKLNIFTTANTFLTAFTGSQTYDNFKSLSYSGYGYAHNDLLLANLMDVSGYSQTAFSLGYADGGARKIHFGSANNASFDTTTRFVPTLSITSLVTASGGRVGINQISPQKMLHVGAAGAADAYIGDVYFYDDGQSHIHSVNGKHLYLNAAASLKLNPEVGGNIDMVIGGGSVGINTTSPSQKLDVNGNINANGTLIMSSAFSFRNRLINGAFDIWQRGTSFSVGGTTTYLADRWCSVQYSGSVASFTQASTGGLSGAAYCLRAQRVAGNTYTATVNSGQFMENNNCQDLAGKTVTLSFYARAGANFSSTSNILVSNIVTGTGNDQNNFTAAYTNKTDNNQNNTLTTSWQRFTQTVTIPSNVTEVGVQFYYSPTGTAGANDYYEVTMVQLEIGNVATPFERRPYGFEMSLCQRYYVPQHQVLSWGQGANSLVFQFTPKVEMRTTPSYISLRASWYFESSVWSTAASINSPNLDTGHLSHRGGDVRVYGTFTNTISYGALTLFGADNIAWSAEL